jgi:hypothetical protein
MSISRRNNQGTNPRRKTMRGCQAMSIGMAPDKTMIGPANPGLIAFRMRHEQARLLKYVPDRSILIGIEDAKKTT